MPLTPTDVANKQFKIAFRGYSLDEVDAFLDEVETELSRLLRENAAGKERPTSGFVPTGAPAEQAPAPAPAAPPPLPALSGMQGQEAALRTLLLAQRTADEAIAEARAEAEQIVSAARQEADTTLSKARSEADGAVSKAKAEADSTLGAAQRKAASVDQDVAARIKDAIGDLDERRRDLEVRIDELRSFEREYRTRLKAYLETQLRDLDSRQGSDDGGAGVPADARAAAVGLTPGSAAGVKPRSAAPVSQDNKGQGSPGQPGSAQPGSARPGSGQADSAQAGSGRQDAPAGPPREAQPTVRAVPPLAGQGLEPVGPFTTAPTAGQEPTDR